MRSMLMGVMAVFLLASSAYPAIVGITCTVAGGNQIYANAPTLASEGWLVQVITSDSSTDNPPDANGNPTGHNYLTTVPALMALYIGSTPEASYGAGEYNVGAFKPSVMTGEYIFIRVWNASTVAAATLYGDSTLIQVPAGTSYTYTPASFFVTLSKPSPSAPTNFIGTGETISSIRWSWDNLAGEVRYDIYSNSDVYITSTPTDDVTTAESGLSAGNYPYTRYVQALLTSGLTTSKSNTFTAYTLACTPDAQLAKGGWDPIDGYYVTVIWQTAPSNYAGTYYYMNRVGTGTDLVGTTLLIGTEEGLSPNTTYQYEVRARNGLTLNAGTYTAYGAKVTATTPPAAPTLSATNVSTSEITWYWNTVAGANSYIFNIDGALQSSGTATIFTSECPNACRGYQGSVVAVSTANGQGAPGNLTRWTLPVVPSPFSGVPSPSQTHSVYLTWIPDSGNYQASYEVQYSQSSATSGFITVDAGTSGKTYTVSVPQSSTPYWFRIRALNPENKYSAYTDAIYVTSSGGGGSGGIPCTISKVRINGRSYLPGEVISSTPIITAIVTGDTTTVASGDVNLSYVNNAVMIDWDGVNPITIPGSNITYDNDPTLDLPPGGYLMTIRIASPISAAPVNGHTFRITCQNNEGNITSWTGSFAVMSGKVEVIGPAYNYPNPFKPLSADPAQNSTKIAYNLNVDANVTLIIYDITGHEVHRMTYFPGTEGGRAGINQVIWNGHSIFGEAVGNGMYVYKIISGNSVIGTGKIVVLD